ncbi:MAG: isochorismatase family protein [Bacteroidales bacterium]|nr:isochorismatase family protein [Bacteroidales bacterium]
MTLTKTAMMKDTALVVVDMLYDFIDGSLACQGADEAVARTLEYIKAHPGLPRIFIMDHHPANHSSFAAQGGPWPPHCVQGTRGGEIHESLAPYADDEGLIFYKGEDPAVEQYSGFEGRNEAGQSMAEVLRLMEISRVIVCGIATEYCVRNTSEDLLKDGFKVTVLKDCLAWVDPEGHRQALLEMEKEGIRLS